jgi:Arc/MetJ family transcription regulator
MAKTQVTVRLDENLLVRARKALGTRTATETIEQALALVTEKAAHDGIIRKYSGVGGKAAFANR